MRRTRLALSVTLLAAALAGCKDSAERVPNAQSDTAPGASSQMAGANSSGTGEYGAPAAAIENQPPGAVGSATPGAAATAALAEPDQQFLAKAAEGGQFEVEIAKLAVEKASDPSVKAFAQMLVDDHGAANDKLRQIATGHNIALPAALPDAKKLELEQLAKLSGATFDREFVRMIGLQDHRHDIAEFEKASQSAQAPDVKRFAESTLPTLRKHLASAQKLPVGGPAKG